MVRQLVRRGLVVALGLTALVCAAFSAAPTQVGAVDYFTAVGCNFGDYTCLYSHNGVNPNAPQYESPRVYYQELASYAYPYGYGYGNPGYSYSYPYYGGYNSYGYGYGYGNSYYGGYYGYNGYPYGTFVYPSGSASSQAALAHVTGYCNLGQGQQCGYPR